MKVDCARPMESGKSSESPRVRHLEFQIERIASISIGLLEGSCGGEAYEREFSLFREFNKKRFPTSRSSLEFFPCISIFLCQRTIEDEKERTQRK